MRYFIDHLKGRHTLSRSLLVNCIGGYLISIIVVLGLDGIRVPPVINLLLFLVILIWGLTGLTAAALNRIWEPTDGSYHRQYGKFRAVFVIFFVVVVIGLLLMDLFR
jgi:hypothetical protein